MKDCIYIGKKLQRIEMPVKGKNLLQFKNHHKQISAPYIIYADFEALNIPVQGPAFDLKESNTRLIANQVPCSFSYIVVRSNGLSRPLVLYRRENAVNVFLNCLRGEIKSIKDSLSNIASIMMTLEDIQIFGITKDCHFCGEVLDGDKVRDHCHITGKYSGAAHNTCNLKLRIHLNRVMVPVVFHNLRSYDSHLIMQAQVACEEKIICIPDNMCRSYDIQFRATAIQL